MLKLGSQGTRRLEREATRNVQDDLPEEVLLDKHRLLLTRLWLDVRFMCQSLQEHVALPDDSPAAWTAFFQRMEKETLEVAQAPDQLKENQSLEAITMLLNCGDKVMTMILNGVLYKRGVLAWDFRDQKEPPLEPKTGPMAEMMALVRNLSSTSLPEKLVMTDSLDVREPGRFTFDRKRKDDQGDTPDASQKQMRLITLCREMRGLAVELRHLKFGKELIITDQLNKDLATRAVQTENIRHEITELYDQCMRLEFELQASKAQKHIPWAQRVGQLETLCEQKELQNKECTKKIWRLEQESTALKVELANLRKEKQELTEKSQKLAAENLPAIARIDGLLIGVREAVDLLTADAELLSNMFKLQVEEHKLATSERDDAVREITKLQRLLKGERLKFQFKEQEFTKKETLLDRTKEAHQTTKDKYTKQKDVIKEAQDRMKLREADWAKLMDSVQEKDKEIAKLKQSLLEASKETNELEKKKAQCLKEFKDNVGRNYSMIMEQFKVT